MLSIFMPESTAAAAQIHSSLIVLITTLTLLVFLIQKDISGSMLGSRARRLARALDVAIIPLLIVFVIDAIVLIGAAIR